MDICPTCKHPRPKNWRKQLNKRRSESIKKALESVENVGRPRKANYEMIYKLRKSGHTIMEIMDALSIGRGSVQHALRLAKNSDNKGE